LSTGVIQTKRGLKTATCRVLDSSYSFTKNRLRKCDINEIDDADKFMKRECAIRLK